MLRTGHINDIPNTVGDTMKPIIYTSDGVMLSISHSYRVGGVEVALREDNISRWAQDGA